MDGSAGARVGPLDWSELRRSPRRETRTIDGASGATGAMSSLARRDVPTSYHLSVVVDDAIQGVTHVVRGRDLFARRRSSGCCRTARPAAPVYLHHDLILGGRAQTVEEPGDTGLEPCARRLTPDDIRRMVGL